MTKSYFGQETELHGVAAIGRAVVPQEILVAGGTVKLSGTSFCLRITPKDDGLAVELLAGEVCA